MELQIGMFKHVQEFCKTGISIESIGQKLYGSKTASLQGKIKLSVFQTPPPLADRYRTSARIEATKSSTLTRATLRSIKD